MKPDKKSSPRVTRSQTVAFYSYKGGVGKSLAIANFAFCLRRLGKSCLVVDLDFDTPSLHLKLGIKDATGIGGFTEFFVQGFKLGLRGSAWDPVDRCWDFTPPTSEPRPGTVFFTNEDMEKPLSDFVFRPFAFNAGDISFEQSERTDCGMMHLLPAGSMNSTEFWQIMMSPAWSWAFGLSARSRLGRRLPSCETQFRDYLAFVSQQFQTLTPCPDYVLVDLRSGAHALSNAILAAWRPKMVCMFALNEDHLDYLENVFSSDRIKDVLTMVPVLCRVPESIDTKGNPHIEGMLNRIGCKDSDLFVIHSSRPIEFNERVIFDTRGGAIRNSRMAQDYAKLFAHLIGIGTDELRQSLGIPEDLKETDRIFRLETENGALINPGDESRNVSFKVETFQLLLQGLQDGLETILVQNGNADQVATQFRKLLFSAGERCGRRFGENLRDSWAKAEAEDRQKRVGIEERLRRWCVFDSDVGFGRFELETDSLTIRGGQFLECLIILRESFLTPATDTQFQGETAVKYNLNGFLEGYVTGVMNEILRLALPNGKEAQVELIQDNDLPRKDARSRNCRLVIRTVDSPAKN